MTPAAEVARIEALCSASIHSMDCRSRWPRIESVCDAARAEKMLQAQVGVGAGFTQSYALGSRVLCTDPNRCVCTHTPRRRSEWMQRSTECSVCASGLVAVRTLLGDDMELLVRHGTLVSPTEHVTMRAPCPHSARMSVGK